MSLPDPDREHRFRTAGGVEIVRRTAPVPLAPDPAAALAALLDRRRGVLLASSYEYPGRYTRWDIGFADPPIEIVARGRSGTVRALNERGKVLLTPIEAALAGEPQVTAVDWRGDSVRFTVREPTADFTEEDRSRQPTVFSALRAIGARFGAQDDARLGLYGAFGYDLAFQFDPIDLRRPRPEEDRDLVLYLPDAILVVDHQAATATEHHYEFTTAGGRSTAGLPRTGPDTPWRAADTVGREADHRPGEYADCVREAHRFFRRGDLFEVVPGQSFFARCPAPPSEVFRRLRTRNPAPYGTLMNLGESEYLVAASPEMYVRVDGRRIETCPISGTVARGEDAIGDAEQILKLLSSEKEASELTMCTDVDRNDKSRVCEPGSVRVIGRRQIEMYSRLIHTVDHVEGRLREEFDALDGFLAHTWAVTVTGAPKLAAMQFIEDHEKSVRRWYGGAIGMIGFDGNMNTGLTLRTVHIRNGAAEVRAGATLLVDSDPEAEEEETRLKAAALLDAIARPDPPAEAAAERGAESPGSGRTVLMVDHQDSFVHTLAAYLRETGAEVVTLRAGFARSGSTRSRRISWSSHRGRAPLRTSGSPTRSARPSRGASPSSGCAWGYRGSSSTSAGGSAPSTTPCTGSPRRSGGGAGGCSRTCRSTSRRGATTPCSENGRPCPSAWRSPRRRTTASSWPSSTAPSRSRRCSSTPSPSSPWGARSAGALSTRWWNDSTRSLRPPPRGAPRADHDFSPFPRPWVRGAFPRAHGVRSGQRPARTTSGFGKRRPAGSRAVEPVRRGEYNPRGADRRTDRGGRESFGMRRQP